MEERNQYALSSTPREARFASPFNSEVRKSLASLLEELAARFPEAAGVVLNARFSDEQILGFKRAARADFILKHKLDPADFGLDNIANLNLNPTLRAWVDWRRAAFTDFVGEMADAYRLRCPEGKVFVNGYAEYYTNIQTNLRRKIQS